jgi:hypothetical protein
MRSDLPAARSCGQPIRRANNISLAHAKVGASKNTDTVGHLSDGRVVVVAVLIVRGKINLEK